MCCGRVCGGPGEKIRVWMAAMHLTVNKHITTPCDLLRGQDDIFSCRTNSQSPASSFCSLSSFFFVLLFVCVFFFSFKRRGQILHSSSHISPVRKKGSLLIWQEEENSDSWAEGTENRGGGLRLDKDPRRAPMRE